MVSERQRVPNMLAVTYLERPFQDGSSSDDSIFDEQLMQNSIATARRARYITRQEWQTSPVAGSSEFLCFNPSVDASGIQSTLRFLPSESSSPTSGVPSAAYIQHPPSAFPPVDMVSRNTISKCNIPFKPSQPAPESARRLNASEMFSFPESFKSKFSAASTRCKESISKSTRLKEKIIARNASVKELSKGVQREMNAGIANVARMIERLDLTTKRSTSRLIPVFPVGTSGFSVKGESVHENSTEKLHNEESGVLVHNVSVDAPSSLDSSLVTGGVEISPSCVQSGHDAVKT